MIDWIHYSNDELKKSDKQRQSHLKLERLILGAQIKQLCYITKTRKEEIATMETRNQVPIVDLLPTKRNDYYCARDSDWRTKAPLLVWRVWEDINDAET